MKKNCKTCSNKFDSFTDDVDKDNCPTCSIMLKDRQNEKSPYHNFNKLLRVQTKKKRICLGACRRAFVSTSSSNRYCESCENKKNRYGQLAFN